MKKAILIMILTGLVQIAGSSVFGGLTKSGTTAAQFLKVPVGSRAIGFGGAYVAVANDISAIYWNPAGLVFAGKNGAASFVHTDWLADTKFDFAAAAIQSPMGTLALSFTILSMDDMPVRTEFEPEGTGEFFAASDMAIGLSYAKSLTDRFSVGFTGKYVRQQIWHMTASTIAMDVGILFKTDFDWLTLGVSVSNFGPKLQYTGKDAFINYDYTADEFGDNQYIFANQQTDQWDLPLMFRFGLSMDVLKTEMNQLKAAVEARHPNDNTESLSLGAEYGFRKRFFLRAGYQSIFESDSEKGLSAGTGFVFYLAPGMPLMLDYAYADWGRLTSVHRFSIEIEF